MTTTKEIQKEFACYSDRRVKNLIIDIYSDRVVFLTGSSIYMQEFFRRRQVVSDFDRGGTAISIKDAEMLGIPTQPGVYHAPRDARKKWERVSGF